ncbi:helix-turn-helix transcriptional regulator [Leifsonia poae]|uniref:helix-turn-helix transcriptional regulator n=1 Tax=Leifsonia poae TaxID=110933 RepID=UPI0022F24A90|nr:LuxR C-terminal-related transcriptional regulator [Leifsonia poae]
MYDPTSPGRSGWGITVTDDAANPPSAPLFGRDRARETVLLVAHRALGQGGALLVTGEAGLGKTALLADIAERLEGWTVLRVHADSFESDLSYSTVERLVRGLNTLSGTRVSVPRPDDEPITVGRLLLDAIDAVRSPVCVVVDDAQWVDEASARALRFVVRRLAEQSFLFAAASRPVANSVVSLFDDVAATTVNHARIELTPLTVADTQELAAHLLGHAVSRRTATRLTEATQGSPLLLSVLLGQLRDTFAEALHPAGWDLPVSAITPLSTAVSAALEGADVSVRNAAEFVAVLRDPLPLPLFGTVAARLGTPVDAEGAVARGLVRSTEHDGVVWVEPAHAILADAIAADLPLQRRVEIHRVAAQVLSGHRALRHRVEAADTADPTLVTELLAAALLAADRGQADQAMSYARSAVHLAAPGDEHERALLEIGLLAMRTRMHERIFDLTPAIEALPASPTRDAVLIELRTLTGDIPGALALALAIDAAPATTPDERAIRSHVAEAIPKILMATRDMAGTVDYLEAGRHHIAAAPTDRSEISDPALRWLAQPYDDLLRLLGWGLIAAGHMRRGDLIAALVVELDQLLDGEESPAAADALVTRARVFILSGDIERARDDLARAAGLVRRFPSSWTAGFARTIYAHVLFLVGEWDESVTLADAAVALALDETDLSGWPIALTASALVRAGRGEAAAVEERLSSASRARLGFAGSYDGDIPFIARAELARALGDAAAQLVATEAAEEVATPASTLGWMTYRVDALAALGRAGDARAALEACRDPRRLWRPFYGSLGWLEGRVLEAEGRHEEAVASYLGSLEEPGSALFPFPHAVAALDAGRLLLTLGTDPERARALLETAAGAFRRLGAPAYLARCTHLLAEPAVADPGGPVAERHDPFAPLTTRERQVAHALAAGMTNKEIAERLYVSVTTVNFHVRNILAKLELTSRRDLRKLSSPRGSRRTTSPRPPDFPHPSGDPRPHPGGQHTSRPRKG